MSTAHEHGDHDRHDHDDQLRGTPTRKLAIALAMTASFMMVEIVVGFLSRSLALISDAGHMLTDAAALALALLAQRIAARARNGERTFGYGCGSARTTLMGPGIVGRATGAMV